MEVVPQNPQHLPDSLPFPLVPGAEGDEVVAGVRAAENEFQALLLLDAFEAPRFEIPDGALEVFRAGLVDLRRQKKQTMQK